MKIKHFDLGQFAITSQTVKIFQHFCEEGDVMINMGITGYWNEQPPQNGQPIMAPIWSGLYIQPVNNNLFHHSFCMSSSHPSQMVSVSHSFYYKFEKDNCFEIQLDCATTKFHPWIIRAFSVDFVYLNSNNTVTSTNNLAEPRNNDGRTNCFWCGGPVKDVQGFSNSYKICTICGK